MSSPSLKESIDFMMRCRRGFDPVAILQQLREQVLSEAEMSVNTLATKILAQQEIADSRLEEQLNNVSLLDPLEESFYALEEIKKALIEEREDHDRQDTAINKGEKVIAASQSAYKNLETNLKEHLECLNNKKNVPPECQKVAQIGATWCQSISKGP